MTRRHDRSSVEAAARCRLPTRDRRSQVVAPRCPLPCCSRATCEARRSWPPLLWFLTSLVSFGLVTWIPPSTSARSRSRSRRRCACNAIVAVSIFILPIILRQSIDRIGRRPLPMLGTAIGGIALFTMIFIKLDATVWLVALAIVGQIGISIGSMVLWPSTAEIYPTPGFAHWRSAPGAASRAEHRC